MNNRADGVRVAHPLFQAEGGGAKPTSALSAKDLTFERCSVEHAVDLCRRWHSRLPNTQRGPWQFAFRAHHGDVTYAVALWHNPSGRCLPNHWLELRRMACAPDAPKNTASRFLGWMVRWFRTNHPDRERCISYQDTAVHTGCIYRASGWVETFRSRARVRDRSKPRVGTRRAYRSNLNGVDADASPKVRWEIVLLLVLVNELLCGLQPERFGVFGVVSHGSPVLEISRLNLVPEDALHLIAHVPQLSLECDGSAKKRQELFGLGHGVKHSGLGCGREVSPAPRIPPTTQPATEER